MKRKKEQLLEQSSPAVQESKSKAQNGVGDIYRDTLIQIL